MWKVLINKLMHSDPNFTLFYILMNIKLSNIVLYLLEFGLKIILNYWYVSKLHDNLSTIADYFLTNHFVNYRSNALL